MKTVFRACVFAFLCFGALSCTKSKTTDFVTAPPANTEPFIYSKIHRNIVQPVTMELGTSSSTLQLGDVVTIFLPYSSVNEVFVKATITMSDELTDLPINTYNLVPSTDPSAVDLTLPDDLRDQYDFFYVTFVVDENYAGKSVSLKTRLEGQIATSQDELIGAFSVAP